MNNRLYMDLHVLQTVPPSCVNRDDTGSPKTAVYGGTTRARVSSQAWKRAMRVMFRDELLNRDQVGERTKKVRQLIAHEIAQIAPDQDAEKLAEAAMSNIGLKISGKTNDLDTLFFLSHAQAKAVAALAVEGTARPDKSQSIPNPRFATFSYIPRPPYPVEDKDTGRKQEDSICLGHL